MDNQEALMRFERYLNRRSPGRSTAKHYVSDVRLFLAGCPKPWTEVTRADIDAFVDHGGEAGWKPATIRRRVAALKAFFDFPGQDRLCRGDRPSGRTQPGLLLPPCSQAGSPPPARCVQ